MTSPVLFLAAALTILSMPGPTNTLLASAASISGTRASLALLLAELGGYLLTICLVGFALRPVLAEYPAVAITLKIAVAVYLVYASYRIWTAAGNLARAHAAVSLCDMFVATVLNPKGLVLALAIVPFGSPAVGWYLLVFSCLAAGSGLLWLLIGETLGRLAGGRRRIVPRTGSLVLVGFAIFIAASAVG